MSTRTRKRKTFNDLFNNILASFINTGCFQFIIYPLIAIKLGKENYGLFLTLIGIINTISISCGNALNNTRLLLNESYSKKSEKGDFPIILISSGFIGFLLVTLYSFFNNYSNVEIILNGLIVVLITFRIYFSVTFRLSLEYNKVLILTIISSIGCLVGVLFLNFFWQLTFLIGELAALVYIYTNTSIMKEKLKKTLLFKNTCSKYSILFFSTIVSNLITYLDRILLLPILGGAAVSIYTVSSFTGKSLGIVMTPIAGVVLSYFSTGYITINRKSYAKMKLMICIMGLIFYIVSFAIAPFLTKILYPSIFSEAMDFFLLANFGALLGVIGNMIQPVTLKYAPTQLQLKIQIVYGVCYLGMGIFFAFNYGILGFCFAQIISNLIRIFALDLSVKKYLI